MISHMHGPPYTGEVKVHCSWKAYIQPIEDNTNYGLVLFTYGYKQTLLLNHTVIYFS